MFLLFFLVWIGIRARLKQGELEGIRWKAEGGL